MESTRRTKGYGPSSSSNPGRVSRSSTATTVGSGSSGSVTSMALSDILKQNPQKVSGRYVKELKLKQYLASIYSRDQWDVHVGTICFCPPAAEMMGSRGFVSCVTHLLT